jgi:hypothetical protein
LISIANMPEEQLYQPECGSLLAMVEEYWNGTR